MLRGAVVAAGPGVLIGVGLAVAVVLGGAAAAKHWPLAAIAIPWPALAGPPGFIAVWQQACKPQSRPPTRPSSPPPRPGGLRAPPGPGAVR